MLRNQVKNFFMLHFHKFSSGSVNVLDLDLNLALDIRNF